MAPAIYNQSPRSQGLIRPPLGSTEHNFELTSTATGYCTDTEDDQTRVLNIIFGLIGCLRKSAILTHIRQSGRCVTKARRQYSDEILRVKYSGLRTTGFRTTSASLSVLGKPKVGDGRSMSVEEYNMNPVTTKEGHINNGPNQGDVQDIEGKILRRHSLSSSFRYLRRHSKTRPKLYKHGEYHGGPPRRRSIAGTFITDPSLKLPPRPKANSFAPDGRRDDANGVYTVDADGKGKEPEKEYDPFQERVVEHPTTNLETLLHLLKGSLGTGILAMPNAFHNAGWALGFVGTIIIGSICTYCIHLLIKCEYELCKRRRLPALNYPATAEAGLLEGPTIFTKLAPISGHVINFFILAYQLGICCVYVVFVASNVKDVVDVYFQKLDVRIYMVIFLLPLILINYVRNLKYLAPFSAVSNIITFVGFGITLYYIFSELHGLNEREPVGEVKNWPLFFGTVLFSLEAIGVIMPLENEMKNPKSFGGTFGVLNAAMVLIISLYTGMGFFGYLRYGDEAKGSITLNIPPEDPLAQAVKLTMAFAIFITHSLQNYVAIDIIWNGYLAPSFEQNPHKLFYEYVVRTLLVLFTFVMGALIPNLELFISFIGAFTLSLLALFFPAFIETSTFWYQRTGFAFYWMCFKNFLLTIFAFMGLIIGGFTSVKSIYEELVLLGVAIPNLELFISLIGAFCLAVLGIAFPAIVDQSTFWYQRKGLSFIFMSLQNGALIIFGLFGLIIGTYVSVVNIYDHFSKGDL